MVETSFMIAAEVMASSFGTEDGLNECVFPGGSGRMFIIEAGIGGVAVFMS